MSVTVYRSTDAGAPVLNGTSGNGLVNLFDICLVGSGTAYGSLPKKGWTKPFSGTNKGVYLTVDGDCYLSVNHDGSNAGGFREAVVRGAEGATDVDTLIDAFPASTDLAIASQVWITSGTLDGVAREWELVAGENFIILSVDFNTTLSDMYIFGKYSAARSANSWAYVISTRANSNATGEALASAMAHGAAAGFSNGRLYAMRSVDGVVKSPRAALITESTSATTNSSMPGLIGPPIPNGDGQIIMSPPQVWVNGGSGTARANPQYAGFFQNLWSPLHDFAAAGRAVNYGDTFNAAGYDTSSQFVLRGARAGASGKWIVETTDTWQDPLA